MSIFHLPDNRQRQQNKALQIPDDIYIPFNAGRQLTKVNHGLFKDERPAHLVSLKEWLLKKYSLDGSGDTSLGGGRYRYSPSTNLYVTASQPSSEANITSTLNAGVLIITIPADTHLYSFEYRGDDTTTDSNGDLTIQLDYEWDTGYNTSFSNVVIPTVNVWDHSLPALNSDIPTSILPIAQSTTTPPARHIIYLQDNDLHFKFESLTPTFSKWSIVTQLI